MGLALKGLTWKPGRCGYSNENEFSIFNLIVEAAAAPVVDLGTKTGKYVPPSLRSGADAAQRRGESMSTRRQGMKFFSYIASCLDVDCE